ncbi:hypothetical protein H0H92_003637 [Tricholoma furcatifolium]|nr:hypothetical protein H0H92_003637 [Tricholoma furcatifolium]
MYCDDDLQDEYNALFNTWNPPPFLRILESEEESFRRISARSLRSLYGAKENVDPARVAVEIDFIRFFRMKAFFHIVEGFYKRCADVLSKWNAYVSGLSILSTYLAVSSNESEPADTAETFQDYTFKDPTIWEGFAEKWKIPRSVEYGFLLQKTAETSQVILHHKVPKIQELCLVNLPSEILDSIFKHASSSQARLLHSTCRQLREIGSRHLVSHRKIAFRKPAMLKYYEGSSPPRHEVIEQASQAARDDTLAFCCFLESRPDLLKKLESLMVVNEWSDMFAQTISDYPLTALEGGKFFYPLFDAFETVITPSVNLATLTFSGLELPLTLIRVIPSLPQLNHLRLLFCTFGMSVLRALFQGAEGTQSSSILNLEIQATNEDTSWFIMLMCPNLVNFAARTVYANRSLFPPSEVIWEKVRFFSNLRYLHLGHLSPHHLPTFWRWLRISSHGNLPALTHFKLEVETYIDDSEILSFLEVLDSAPLEVLSIDGALEAGLDLFNWIAAHFPLLKGFTMIRRESTRQTRLHKSFSWPVPSWEYARCFSAFSRLQHFEWNNHSLAPVYSTYSLRIWEEGHWNEDDWEAEKEADKLDNFSPEEDLDAVLFGIYCGTLTTFVNESFAWQWRILRPSLDTVKAVPITGASSKWNPHIYGTWPVQFGKVLNA